MITALAVSFVVLFFYFKKGVQGMRTLQTELIEKGFTRNRSSGKSKKNTKAKVKQRELLSDRELHELMGINRDTYKRGPGGAIRKR